MSQALLDIVCKVLIHSVWMALAVYLITRSILYFTTKAGSAFRYRISVGGLFTYCISIILTVVYYFQHRIPANRGIDNGSAQLFPSGAGFSMKLSSETSQAHGISYWITLIYIIGVTFFFLRSIYHYYMIRNEIKQSKPITGLYNELCQSLIQQLRIKRVIRIIESGNTHSPALFGFLKPVIIVPAGILGQMPFDQVEAILMHELLHVRRYDFLINMMQNLVEILFFYNPFVWMLSSIIREEREIYCDDGVVASGSHPGTYAKALYTLSLSQSGINPFPVAALGSNKQHLLIRIQRILKNESMKNSMRPGVFIALLLIAGTIGILSLSAFESPVFNIEKNGRMAIAISTEQVVFIPDTVVKKADPVISEDKEIRKHVFINQDTTLTEEEKQELKKVLEEARAQLEASDWEDIIADFEADKLAILKEMPAELEEELLRLKEQLESVDEDFIKEHMEKAHEQLMLAQESFNIQDFQADIDASMKELQEKLEKGELFNEDEMRIMNEELDKLKDINFEDILQDMQEAMENLEMDMVFDLDLDIDLDSILKDFKISMESFDLNEFRKNMDDAMMELNLKIQELSEEENE